VNRYQKGITSLDFTEARDSERQWYQLGHMQVCTSLQTDNNASIHRSVFTDRMSFLPPNQQHHSTEGDHKVGEKKFSEFSRLFHSRKFTFPVVITTKSEQNIDLHQGSFHTNSSA